MRRALILSLFFLLLMTACAKQQTAVPLDQLPTDYSLEAAKDDNCVVFENGDITAGQSVWDDFLETKDAGKAVTVRLAYYYTLGKPSQYGKDYYKEIKDNYPVLYLKDLTFNGETFSISGYEEGELLTWDYPYLVKYIGEPSSATATFSAYTYYVLVNDRTITWAEIESGLTSSRFGDWVDHDRVYSDRVYK